MSRGRLLLVLATISSLGLAAVALLGGPVPPPFVVGLVLLFYFSVLGIGALVPSWEMYGDVLWKVPGASGCVALTFDDGPDPASTTRVLDVLAKRGARATFFVLGERAERHPAILRRMIEDGHSIGLHSFDHNRLYAFLPPSSVRADIERCRAIVEAATGVRPLWFRPPVGQMSPRTARGVILAQAETVGWSVRARDGLRGTSPDDALRRIEPKLESGAIVLLHDAWERPSAEDGEDPAGARALDALLDALERRSLQAVSLDELVARGSEESKALSGAS